MRPTDGPVSDLPVELSTPMRCKLCRHVVMNPGQYLASDVAGLIADHARREHSGPPRGEATVTQLHRRPSTLADLPRRGGAS